MVLLDKVGWEQLFNFFINCCVALRIKSSTFLDNWFVSWVNIESVGYDGRIDSWHILMQPSKDILMLLKEIDELVPEASRQMRSHLDRALWVLVVQLNGFQLLDRNTVFTAFCFFATLVDIA